MCGEQASSSLQRTTKPGSPPRVRGTDSSQQARNTKNRITPACAGNSGTVNPGAAVHGDHPRVCGEQIPDGEYCSGCKGSPPRVRGTVLTESETVYAQRITPACAGNSISQGYG